MFCDQGGRPAIMTPNALRNEVEKDDGNKDKDKHLAAKRRALSGVRSTCTKIEMANLEARRAAVDSEKPGTLSTAQQMDGEVTLSREL
jgi:hypothetical protein